MLTDILVRLAAPVAGILAMIGGIWAYGSSKKREGRTEADRDAQEADNARANDIRSRVDAGSVRDHTDSGFRD